MQLITTPTQRSGIVMMLREAGFDHVWGMPRHYLAARFNSDAQWQWKAFYGVKGDPPCWTWSWLVSLTPTLH